ncbi:MAG TPA: PQQ-binding-like beta-propeller repeat protein [Opitutaceae bacterium]|nr:PQQ-binding-like beta-propeller repeat protein [Opitutaceae bacterium]
MSAKELSQGFRDGQVIVKPKDQALATINAVERDEGLTLKEEYARFGHIRVIKLTNGESVKDAVARLKATGRYAFVEPDFLRHGMKVPNDTDFSSQWALSNNGSGGGIAGADIHAEGAWDIITNTSTSSSNNVIVGIVDSGAFLTHEDLVSNLWVNPSPGTVASYATEDSSGNTTASVSETDSTNGLNAVAKSGPPEDDLGHGTHVSGIVGAVGNNSLGVSGVAWKTQLMELKFISSADSGSTSDELPCIEYAVAHKVSVLNASYGDQTFSQAEMDAIYAAGKAGVIFVCAAGNSAENVDISGFFPADYPLDNIICVGASDNRDNPVYFTNYGSGSVELFAPGEDIISTYFSSSSSYMYESGTSMAAPFVTGTVALLRSQFPNDTYRETINRVLNSVDTIPALAGKSQTGGRLNLTKALTTAANTAPNALFANRTNLVGLDPYTRSNNTDTPATPESGTPAIASGTGHSLWWQWTAPEDAQVEIDTSGTGGGQYATGGSTYATALGVYTGNSIASLTAVATSTSFAMEPLESGNGAQVAYSEVSFHTSAGQTYQINVQGQGGAAGQTILAINTTPDNDAVAKAKTENGPSFTVADANVNATLETSEPKILGHSGGHSLWYAWTAPKSGTFAVSGYSYDFTPDVAVYTGTTVGSLSLVTSAAGGAMTGASTDVSQCVCSFNATSGTTYLIAMDGSTSGDVGDFTLTLVDSLWQATTQDSITCSPSVAPDGTVYVGSNDNALYAYNTGGALKWSHASEGIFDTSSAAVAADGTVYAGSTDGNVYAYAEDGTLKWQYTIQGAAGSGTSGNSVSCSTALSAGGVIYTHGSDGKLYAINSDGTLKWMASVAGDSYAAPTIAPDGTIYISSDSGVVYAVNPDGTSKWTFTAPVSGEPIYTAAAIDASGNLYVATLNGNVYSLTAAGALRWTYAAGNGITSAPALANGSVYFGGYDGNLYSLAASSGAFQWKCAVGSQVRASAPAVDANGTVYIGSYDHNIYAVNASGSIVRTFATDDYVRSSPVISGNRMYVGSEDHKIYAFDLGVGEAVSDWPMYQFDAKRVGHTESQALAIATGPASQTAYVGGSLTLSVSATGPGALSYQWNFNGSAIPGATGATYSVSTVTSADAGSYTVTVTSAGSSVTSAPATVTVSAAAPGRIVNLSARANVGTGSNILIAGFVIRGSGSKQVILRGVGPTLAMSPYDVSGVLAQPALTLLNSTTNAALQSVTAWGNSAALAAAFIPVGAFALQSASDSAIEVPLPAGGYTSQISGVSGTTGVALAEIYDADTGVPATNLINISARANIGTGSNILIAGFVVQGTLPVKVLLRGVGPTLSSFGVAGAISQPEIDLFNGASSVIQTNKGWANDASVVAADTQAGAFALPMGSADAAMVATLPPGSYTLEMSGQNGTTGVGLVEVYLLQ